jgi:hypothetical protein
MLLILCVAVLTVSTRFSISPVKTGVALSYIISVQTVGRISLRTETLPQIVCIILAFWLYGPPACRGREQHGVKNSFGAAVLTVHLP